MTTFLELYGDGDTLADRMRAVARGTVVVDVVKGLLDDARSALQDSANEEEARTGARFTARLDGVTALITDPQPKPQVTDHEAFAGWFADAYPDEVEHVARVEVVDQWAAALILTRHEEVDPVLSLEALENALTVVYETVLPEKALDLAYDRGRLHVTDEHVIDVETGEQVPGLTVSKAASRLQVRLDKHARAEAQREVRRVLGIPAEVGGGS